MEGEAMKLLYCSFISGQCGARGAAAAEGY